MAGKEYELLQASPKWQMLPQWKSYRQVGDDYIRAYYEDQDAKDYQYTY